MPIDSDYGIAVWLPVIGIVACLTLLWIHRKSGTAVPPTKK